MSLLLAVLSSVLLGGADFVGGMAARRTGALVVVVCSTAAGLVTALLLALTMLPASPAAADLAWGALAGLTGCAGAVLLYRALARGVMLVVAPTAAVAAALLPVAAGLVRGEHLGPRAAAGVVVGLVALALVSRGSPRSSGVAPLALGGSVLLALGAGVSFGAFMVCLAHTAPASGLWPLVSARGAALAILLLAASATGAVRRLAVLPAAVARLAVAAGVLDIGSSALYLAAVRHGSLVLVGLLASLSPVSTLLLARVLLGERTGVLQRLGAALALSSVVLLATG